VSDDPVVTEGVLETTPRPPVGTAVEAAMYRSGHFDAHDGKGWQPLAETRSVADSGRADREAWDAQRQHRDAMRAALRARLEALTTDAG
jgi:hypothetical protein